MDITQLSILVTNAVAAQKTGEPTPAALGKAWALLERRMGQKPSAQEALEDLKHDPHDPDLQTVIKVQLAKMLGQSHGGSG